MPLVPVTFIPIMIRNNIQYGDNIAEKIIYSTQAQGNHLQSGDIIVITHKIISKAEGMTVALSKVKPSKKAKLLAHRSGKDPRLVEVILRESTSLLKINSEGVMITRHKLGFIAANSCVDRSNVEGDNVVVLPKDPDASARRIMETIRLRLRLGIPVIICDTHGRPFRLGTIGVCVGIAGFSPIRKYRGKPDLFGRCLVSTEEAIADEISSAANLLMGQANEGVPAVIVRGIKFSGGFGSFVSLIRPPEENLFS